MTEAASLARLEHVEARAARLRTLLVAVLGIVSPHEFRPTAHQAVIAEAVAALEET